MRRIWSGCFPGSAAEKTSVIPPILPIVYYEGAKKWTAPADLADKILCGELLGKYLPHFRYQLIMLHEFSNEELLARKDEISLAMLINKIQTYEDVSAFSGLPQEQIQHILKNTPENILEIMAEILRALLYRIKLPENTVPEVAFAGKSNVGKSSLINALMNRKSLARTSSQPGKTQTINFYQVNGSIYFVDLPGYGYARANEHVKAQWGKMVENYLAGKDSALLLQEL